MEEEDREKELDNSLTKFSIFNFQFSIFSLRDGLVIQMVHSVL